jgi:hypothetical protein
MDVDWQAILDLFARTLAQRFKELTGSARSGKVCSRTVNAVHPSDSLLLCKKVDLVRLHPRRRSTTSLA